MRPSLAAIAFAVFSIPATYAQDLETRLFALEARASELARENVRMREELYTLSQRLKTELTTETVKSQNIATNELILVADDAASLITTGLDAMESSASIIPGGFYANKEEYFAALNVEEQGAQLTLGDPDSNILAAGTYPENVFVELFSDQGVAEVNATGGVRAGFQAKSVSGRQAATMGVKDGKSAGLELRGHNAKITAAVFHDEAFLLISDDFQSTQIHAGRIRLIGDKAEILVNGRGVNDIAELFELATRDGVVAGTVMSVAGGYKVGPSSAAYDKAVVGVVSGAGGLSPGLVVGERADGTTDLPVAIAGMVYVRVSNEGGDIEKGDLLVASSTPGVAMRLGDKEEVRAAGRTLGKALEAFTGDFGLIRMLVGL